MGQKGPITAAQRMQAQILHFLKPFYLLHYVGLLAYVYVRDLLVTGQYGFRTMEEEQWLEELVGTGDLSGIPRETQIVVCWAVIVFSRTLKASSVQEVVGAGLFFGKACICVGLFIADWYLPFYFFAYWIVLFCIMGEPSFECVNKRFTKLDKKSLDGLYQVHEPGSEKSQVYWFVNVWASWQKAGASKTFNTTFAELSAEHANHYCRFAKVDAGRAQFQEFIHNLKMDTSATSKQVPSLILFRNGKEIRRLPVDDKGSYLSAYTRKQLEQHFDFKKIGEETSKLDAARQAQRMESKKVR